MATAKGRDAESRDRILAIADSLGEAADGGAESEAPAGWISFRLAGRLFALPVTHVRGVHRCGHVTPLPKSPPAVRGLTNLRGRVITVIDLATRLGLAATAIDDRSRILEAEIGHRRLGLLSERTESLLRVRPSEVVPPADEGDSPVPAAAKIETAAGPVLLLDPERLLEGAEAAPGDGAARAREAR